MEFRKYILTFFALACLAIVSLNITSCKKDKDEVDGIEREMLDLAKQNTGYIWYKHDAAALPKSSGSGHSNPYFRTRFNSVAAQMLDGNGVLMDSVSFPEGALIVKELHDSDKDLKRYAILYKKSEHEYADANGWVWGYINEDETVAAAASDRGAACINCHSQSGNIDYILMKKFFP